MRVAIYYKNKSENLISMNLKNKLLFCPIYNLYMKQVFKRNFHLFWLINMFGETIQNNSTSLNSTLVIKYTEQYIHSMRIY